MLAAVFSYLRGKETFHHQSLETMQVSAKNAVKAIEQVNTQDPVSDNKSVNANNSNNADIKSDPILRKTYAAYLLMNTELGETVLNNITSRELIYAIATTSGLPNWFINFVNSINNCQFNEAMVESLMKHVNVPDWLGEVVNNWLKTKSLNK